MLTLIFPPFKFEKKKNYLKIFRISWKLYFFTQNGNDSKKNWFRDYFFCDENQLTSKIVCEFDLCMNCSVSSIRKEKNKQTSKQTTYSTTYQSKSF